MQCACATLSQERLRDEPKQQQQVSQNRNTVETLCNGLPVDGITSRSRGVAILLCGKFSTNLPYFNFDLFVTVGQMLQIISRVHDECDVISL